MTDSTEQELNRISREQVKQSQEQNELRSAVLEIKTAITKIQETLHIVVRIEERLSHVQRDTKDVKDSVKQERNERIVSVTGIGERVGKLEEAHNTLVVSNSLNSHGRNILERYGIPVLTSGVTAILVALILKFTGAE